MLLSPSPRPPPPPLQQLPPCSWFTFKQKVADLHWESVGSWNFKDSSTLFWIHYIKENAFWYFMGYGSRKMSIVSKFHIVFLIPLKRPQIQRLSKLTWGRGLDSGDLMSGWDVKWSQVMPLTPAYYSQELEHVTLELFWSQWTTVVGREWSKFPLPSSPLGRGNNPAQAFTTALH